MTEQKLIPKEFIKESSTVFRNTKEIKAVLDGIKREVANANYVTPVNNGTSDSKDKIAHKIASIKVYDKDNNEVKWSKKYNEANTLKAQEEVTYIVKLTGDKDIKDEKVFNSNLKKVKFYFWVQDEDGKRIEITTPTKTHGIQKRTGLLTSDRTTDIFELRKGETLNANLQQSAYFYATRVTYDLEKKEARITVKWSKWMDRYMARMEATQHFAKGDGGNTTCSRYIQAQPEILKGYWTNEKKENIDNKTVGYKDTVYLYIKTLGMGGKTVTTQLWEEGITFMGNTSSNDEKLSINENILWKLEGRHNYKKLVIPDQSTEEYKEQRKAVWEKDPLDIYFAIPSEKDTKGYKHKFGDLLKLSSKEQIVDAYFAKAVKQKAIKDGTVADEKDKDTKKAEQQTVYERIDSTSLGSEVYLVAETTNMHGKNLTLKVFDNEELIAKDTDTSINLIDKGGNQQYQLQNVKVDAKTGKAITKIKLRPKSDEDYKKLKEKFKDDKKAKLFIGINYTDSGHIPRYKKFLDDDEFEVIEPAHIYHVHINGYSFEKIADGGKEIKEYKYIIFDGEKKLKTHILKINKHDLLDFPHSGKNWGRYGTRDKGGDNWIDEETAAAFFGFLYSLPKNNISETLYYNDISANDKRNIGHKTHRTGKDIDIRYPGADNSAGEKLWGVSKTFYGTEEKFLKKLEDILEIAVKWDFLKKHNYAYKKDVKNTKGSATSVHQNHFHIGYKR